MKPENRGDMEEIFALEAGLRQLAPLYTEGTRLPPAGDLLQRARLRQRELAGERLAQWYSRTRILAGGLLALAAAATAFATRTRWTGWLLQRILEPLLARSPVPPSADVTVVAGAVLAGSIAVVWVLQQFAEE